MEILHRYNVTNLGSKPDSVMNDFKTYGPGGNDSK